MTQDSHLDDETLAAFVDGGLDAESRQRAAAHLLECDDCRGVIVATGRLEPPRTQRDRRLWFTAAGLSAAAALVMMVLSQRRSVDQFPRERERDLAAKSSLGLVAHSPAADMPVNGDTLVFRWSMMGADATYQLTLSSEAGAIIWMSRTGDTAVVPPDSIIRKLENDRPYYWQVDAVLPSLRSASTGQRRLIPERR